MAFDLPVEGCAANEVYTHSDVGDAIAFSVDLPISKAIDGHNAGAANSTLVPPRKLIIKNRFRYIQN